MAPHDDGKTKSPRKSKKKGSSAHGKKMKRKEEMFPDGKSHEGADALLKAKKEEESRRKKSKSKKKTSSERRSRTRDKTGDQLERGDMNHSESAAASAADVRRPPSSSSNLQPPTLEFTESRPGAFHVRGSQRQDADDVEVEMEVEEESVSSNGSWSASEGTELEEEEEEAIITAQVTPFYHPYDRAQAAEDRRGEDREELFDEEVANIPNEAATTHEKKKTKKWEVRLGIILCLVATALLGVLIGVIVLAAGGGAGGSSDSAGTAGGIQKLEDNPSLLVFFVQWGVAFDSCTSVQQPLEIEFSCGQQNDQVVEVLDYRFSSGATLTCSPRTSPFNVQTCQFQPAESGDALLTGESVFMVGCSLSDNQLRKVPFTVTAKSMSGEGCGRVFTGDTVVGEVSTGVSVLLYCPSSRDVRPKSECNAGGSDIKLSSGPNAGQIRFCSTKGECEQIGSGCRAATPDVNAAYIPVDGKCFITDKDRKTSQFLVDKTQLWGDADRTGLAPAFAQKTHMLLSSFDTLP